MRRVVFLAGACALMMGCSGTSGSAPSSTSSSTPAPAPATTPAPAPAPVTLVQLQAATRSWDDVNGNAFPDCDPNQPLATGECGAQGPFASGSPTVTASSQALTFKLHVTAAAGVGAVQMTLTSPSGAQTKPLSAAAPAGTVTDTTAVILTTFATTAEKGDWTIAVTLADKAGAGAAYSPATLSSSGLFWTVTVR